MPDLLQKDGFTLLNTAQIVASISVVTIKCPCKQIIMGQMGQPLVCTSCKKTWWVSATAKVTIQEVLVDAAKAIDSLTQ